MSAQNPTSYFNNTTVNSNRYNGYKNRFGNTQNIYELKNSILKQISVNYINTDDLVNDAILSRIRNVTEDGVRIHDNYILKEPLDIKNIGGNVTIYKKGVTRYNDEVDKTPKEKLQTFNEYNKVLQEYLFKKKYNKELN